MSTRELLLLSPYSVPAENASLQSHEDIAAFLNGYSALWHPAVLCAAGKPPVVASPYDHEQPGAGNVYAVPDSPPLVLPDDWDQRVHDAGAISFRATSDRQTTLANLQAALESTAGRHDSEVGAGDLGAWTSDPRVVAPFCGLGFGYLQLTALIEAMHHENLLTTSSFWAEVRQAVELVDASDSEAFRRQLCSAANQLLGVREALYPVAIHLLDIHVLDEQEMGDRLTAACARGTAFNLIACGSLLEQLARQHPEHLATLRERLAAESAEVCGGVYVEREDPLLPLESQLWNLRKGSLVSREVLGSEIRTFARKRSAFDSQMPRLLTSLGYRRALLLTFDDAGLPTFQAPVVNWPAPGGQQVEAFARTPYPADGAITYFHLAHYLHQTIMQDQVATLSLLHTAIPTSPWYDDLVELSLLAPVLGQWTTFSRYFDEVVASEQAGTLTNDDFHVDYLTERTEAGISLPVSGPAVHVRQRRRLDAAWTLAALQRGLTGPSAESAIDRELGDLEDQVELGQQRGHPSFQYPEKMDVPFVDPFAESLDQLSEKLGRDLAGKVLSRSPANEPGYLILNACGFARRVALELPAVDSPLPVGGPIKACQAAGPQVLVVADVPALGFTWLPRSGPPGTPPMPMRMRLADERHVRNEYFEAEVDTATGGLRGIWDHRDRTARVGQQLVFNPGSTMKAREVKVVSEGPALGEVVAVGNILSQQGEVLAGFRQRFRAWLGRPILEMRIEITPERPPEGYPWHSYFGSRFAWRDERALMLRGASGVSEITSHTRPTSPDYLEIRKGRQNTVLFTGGLPFQQRHGSRMLDVILVAPGEPARVFELALGLDRDYPMQTALGLVTPAPLVPVLRGPPATGPTGWLFHLDAPNILLSSLRPAPDGADGIVARLRECGQYGGTVEFRCARNPSRAELQDARGELIQDLEIQSDAAIFEASPGDLVQLRIDF